MSWSCARCPKKRAEDLAVYTRELLRVYSLQRAGYPLCGGALSEREWHDLGEVRAVLEEIKRHESEKIRRRRR